MATDRNGRPFSLLDGMILTAASAVGLAPARALIGELEQLYENGMAWQRFALIRVYTVLFPLALCLTVAALGLCLRSGRGNGWRRRIRGVGALACMAAIVGVLLYAGLMAGGAWRMLSWENLAEHTAISLGEVPTFPGLMVAGSWLTSLLGRRWKVSAHWTETLARLVGAVWLLILLLWCWAILS